ncbi:hypothetical protein KIPB_008334, partial [Kipferlia bialata]
VTGTTESGETVDLFLKAMPKGSRIDATREVSFYAAVRRGEVPGVSGVCPLVLSEEADYETGKMEVLMEDLAASGCIGLNFICGNQIWGVPEEKREKIHDTTYDVVEGAFIAGARMHAATWCDPKVMALKWLKGVRFFDGSGQAVWQKGLDDCRALWARGKERFATEDGLTLSPKLERIMDQSLAAASFESMHAHITDPSTPFALCHGDFHAANMFLRPQPTPYTPCPEAMADRLVYVDWSEVGVWEPVTELAQMIMSDTRPEIMDQSRTLVETYQLHV